MRPRYGGMTFGGEVQPRKYEFFQAVLPLLHLGIQVGSGKTYG